MTPEESTIIAVQLSKVEQKLDDTIGAIEAIRLSLKEDIHDLREEARTDLQRVEAQQTQKLDEIKEQTTATNGRVSDHDKAIAMLKGAVAVIALATPFLLFLLDQAANR